MTAPSPAIALWTEAFQKHAESLKNIDPSITFAQHPEDGYHRALQYIGELQQKTQKRTVAACLLRFRSVLLRLQSISTNKVWNDHGALLPFPVIWGGVEILIRVIKDATVN